MAMTRKQEERALTNEERDLVARTHHPQVQELSDRDLADLVKLVRERRDRARGEASRQRREQRGKAAPKGTTPAAGDAGTQVKHQVLANAVRRLNSERSRRDRMSTKTDMVTAARKALALKKAGADRDAVEFNSRTAHAGMRKVASERRQSLVRPMELGRQRQAAKVAQAKRDAKG